MIINYFINIILVGKIASPNWLPYIYWTQKYIKYKGCKLWNNLSLDLKSITSNKLFNKLKIFLRSSSD